MLPPNISNIHIYLAYFRAGSLVLESLIVTDSFVSIPRHPSSSDRPKFREMVLILISNEGEVLHVPQEALDTHRMAGELGAPLEAGEDMYPDLQMTYTNN